MSLAEGRAPRRTAGNRLSGLLQAEEEDEFYQTTYGGFNEESGDDEYRGEHSDSDDEVDSDFDIDEGDEPGSEQDEAEPRRRRRVLTKAYREPLKSLRAKKAEGPRGGSQKGREVKCLPLELQEDGGDSRKHMRQSTTEHTRQTFLRLQERQVQSKRKKGGTSYERPLTQEELLEEAKITEEINLRSLGEGTGLGSGMGSGMGLGQGQDHRGDQPALPGELRAAGGGQEEAGAEEEEDRGPGDPVLVPDHAPPARARPR
ncbi:vacuolar protein sorting-associated protein 72 homolog isoform X2 [Pyrgilauda ruficollis]|uniref:vacuolar protein sorting-associated protein 72 homolog isoform X2 n=1 Tax=Pyrgilauda ruficollis TaxID=221976 RepID=UPI001B876B2B|nr:vacuolar protein sorting-associated protein 72 homolog isoform X2 [Pyrgilauda ruficollis]